MYITLYELDGGYFLELSVAIFLKLIFLGMFNTSGSMPPPSNHDVLWKRVFQANLGRKWDRADELGSCKVL